MARVREWMTATPICVSTDTPIARAAVLMSRHNIRHLPVIDARARVVGVVTDFAVFGRGVLVGEARTNSELWFPYSQDAEPGDVSSVMQKPELLVDAEDDLESALRVLAKAGQDAAIAVDRHQHAVGILTEHDPVRYAAAMLEDDRRASTDASRPVHTTSLDEELFNVHREMLERWIRHLVVLDEDGRVHSVISYRDVIAAEAHLGSAATVADAIPSFGAKTLPQDATTAECARWMARFHIGCIPLVDQDNRPLAMVTRTNILHATADILEDESLFDTA